MFSVGFSYRMVDGYCSVTISKVVAKGLPYLHTVERRGTEGFRTKLFICTDKQTETSQAKQFPPKLLVLDRVKATVRTIWEQPSLVLLSSSCLYPLDS